MASALGRRHFLPIAAASAATFMILKPGTVYADDPPTTYTPRRKPIYDELPTPPTTSPKPTEPSTSPPTPTDQLAAQIRLVRLYINSQYATLQSSLNTRLNDYLTLEHRITSTVASLAPPRSSGEQVLPGLIYVSVAAMAGSILTRRRAWPIRLVTPLAVATGAAWWFIPITMQNVSALVWEWEKMVPQVAEKHLEARKGLEQGIDDVRKKVEEGRRKVDGGVREVREIVEDWVKKQ